MNLNSVSIKYFIKNYWKLMLSLTIICLLQYLLYFFGKTVYLSAFLLIIFFLYLVFLNYNKKNIFAILIIFFILTPIYLPINRDFGNYFGINIVVTLLFFGILSLFQKKISSKKKDEITNNKGKLKYLIIFLLLILILLTIFLNQDETGSVILRIKNPEEYFKKVESTEYNGKEYKNNVIIYVDYPEDNTIVSGLFYIEGWAANISDIPDSKIYDVSFYLNYKPENGGKFLGKKYFWKRREDVQKIYGDKYKDSGYYFEINSRFLKNGLNKIYIYANSNYFGWVYTVLNINVRN